jgi:hypothetical protein
MMLLACYETEEEFALVKMTFDAVPHLSVFTRAPSIDVPGLGQSYIV